MPNFGPFQPLILDSFSTPDLIIIGTSLVASLLTLISGFGLGTMLLPVFALFFELELAVAITAVVHLLNNGFKFGLLWRQVDLSVFLRFGVPGILGAWLGAELLSHVDALPYLYPGLRKPVGLLAVIVGLLMMVFAVLEVVPGVANWSVSTQYLVPGGLTSGFFGGLSGHQGALRSIFLLRAGLSKEVFIATGVAIALLVDLTRIPLYLRDMPTDKLQEQWLLLTLTTAAAFLGAWLGKRLVPKITVRKVQLVVAGSMVAIAAGLIAGLI